MKVHLLPDNDVVKMAATDLIRNSGCTTTLEVKNYLRQQGYYALQKDISQRMRTVALHENWLVVDNGKFFIYSFQLLV